MLEEVNQTELARRLALTPRQIRNLHEHGLPHRRDGRSVLYPWPEVRDWYTKFKQEEDRRRRGGGQELNLQHEKARKLAADAEKAEMELAKARGELIHIEDVEGLVRRPLEQVAAALGNAPSRYASDLAEEADLKIPIAMRMLEDILRSVREDLRRAIHEVEAGDA